MLNRRHFLIGGLGTVALSGCHTSIAQTSDNDDGMCELPQSALLEELPNSFKNPLPRAQTLTNIYQNKQYTLFGDTNHGQHLYDEFFWSRENIDCMVAAGVKYICVEQPPHNQDLYDRLANGEKDPEEYASYNSRSVGYYTTRDESYALYMAQALGVRYAYLKGIKVWTVNSTTPEIQEERNRGITSEYRHGLTSYRAEVCGDGFTTTPALRRAYNQQNPELYRDYRRSWGIIARGRNDDRGRTELIKQLCGDERTVIHFGNAHFDDVPTSIKTLLGPDNTTHIEFVDSPYHYKGSLNEPIPILSRQNNRDTPDFIYSLEGSAVFATPCNRYTDLAPVSRFQLWRQNNRRPGTRRPGTNRLGSRIP